MIRNARAVQGLVQALQHQDPDVVEAAAEALSGRRWSSDADPTPDPPRTPGSGEADSRGLQEPDGFAAPRAIATAASAWRVLRIAGDGDLTSGVADAAAGEAVRFPPVS